MEESFVEEPFLEEYITGDDYDSDKKLVEETEYGVKAVEPTESEPVVGGDLGKDDLYEYTDYEERATVPPTDDFGPGVPAEKDISETTVSY